MLFSILTPLSNDQDEGQRRILMGFRSEVILEDPFSAIEANSLQLI